MDCVVVRSVGDRCVVEQGRGGGDAAYLKARPRPPKHSSRYFGGREGGGFSSFLPPSISFFSGPAGPFLYAGGKMGGGCGGKGEDGGGNNNGQKRGSAEETLQQARKEEGAAWENSFLFPLVQHIFSIPNQTTTTTMADRPCLGGGGGLLHSPAGRRREKKKISLSLPFPFVWKFIGF